MSVAMAVNFVCDVDRAAAVFRDSESSFLSRFEVPDGVVKFWVLEQLLGCHWRHDGWLVL